MFLFTITMITMVIIMKNMTISSVYLVVSCCLDLSHLSEHQHCQSCPAIYQQQTPLSALMSIHIIINKKHGNIRANVIAPTSSGLYICSMENWSAAYYAQALDGLIRGHSVDGCSSVALCSTINIINNNINPQHK